MNILIVEDEVTSTEVLKHFLEPYGECDTVQDGEAALAKFTQQIDAGKPYDLVCLDIMMPRMDGIVALRKIREYESQKNVGPLNAVKIIMTTSVDAPSEVLNAFKLGCEGYVVKPVQKASLLRELKKLNLI